MSDKPLAFLAGRAEDEVFDALLRGMSKRVDQLRTGCGWGTILHIAATELVPKESAARIIYENRYRHHRHEGQRDVDYQLIMAGAWRFVLAGLAYPILIKADHGERLYQLEFTEKGFARLRQYRDRDNPARPGYLARLMTKHPRIDDEVFARLQDAEACLDADLARPALVMMGIAAEVTTTEACAVVRTLNLGKPKSDQFRDRLVTVMAAVGQTPLSVEEKHQVNAALVAIETVRDFRNDAAHPGNEVPDMVIARDRFASMCLHLPIVWEVLVLPNRPPPEPHDGA